MAGFTRNVAAPEGKVNITINSDEDGPLEVFINVGRAGSDVAALAEALGRLISLQLRLPSTMSQEERLRQVANQLRGIGGSRSIGFGRDRVLSLPDAVAQAIYRHLEEHPTPPKHANAVPVGQLALPVSDPPAASPTPAGAADGYARTGSTPAPTAVLTGNLCPQCGSSSSFVHEEGCRTCHNCGYSEC
jgi:ribonucleoside-diphosphate reductase alpha chain